MDVISFAWTTAALVAGHKTVTRRDWRPAYAARFKAGQVIAAYDRSRRNNGRKIGEIRLTHDPLHEDMSGIGIEDYWHEGFAWIHAHPEFAPSKIFGEVAGPIAFARDEFEAVMRSGGESLWTIRFEVVDITFSEWTAGQLLRPEITAVADHWAKALGLGAEHAIRQAKFRQALSDWLTDLLNHEPTWHGKRQVAPVFDVVKGSTFCDDLLHDALEASGLSDVVDPWALPDCAVRAWPGLVEASTGDKTEILFTCMPIAEPELHPAIVGGEVDDVAVSVDS